MAFITSAALPRSSLAHGVTPVCHPRPAASKARRTPATATPPAAPFTIEAAKHAQFKATKKAERKRPRKHRPSDINRRAPSFNTEPLRTEGYVFHITFLPTTLLLNDVQKLSTHKLYR